MTTVVCAVIFVVCLVALAWLSHPPAPATPVRLATIAHVRTYTWDWEDLHDPRCPEHLTSAQWAGHESVVIDLITRRQLWVMDCACGHPFLVSLPYPTEMEAS